MELKLFRLNFKRILNQNFIFMLVVSLLFGISATFVSSVEADLLIYSTSEIILKGYIFLFLFFSVELSKDLLQRDKITKKIEWLLANGTKISEICINHTIVLFTSGTLLLLPLIIVSSMRLGLFPIVALIDFYVYTFLCSLLVNVSLLLIKNMNKFINLGFTLGFFQFLASVLDMVLSQFTGQIFWGTLARYAFATLLILVMIRLLNKERIVSAYY